MYVGVRYVSRRFDFHSRHTEGEYRIFTDSRGNVLTKGEQNAVDNETPHDSRTDEFVFFLFLLDSDFGFARFTDCSARI